MRVWSGSKFCLLWLVFLSTLSTIVFRPSYGDIVQDLDDDDIGGSSSKRRMINFASHQAGAVIVDRAPSNGKGFNNLLNDDRDKYAICASNERKWVVVGLSEEVAITSVAIANYEKYSSTVREFQLLGSLKYPTSEWNDLGTYTAQLMLGEQHFNITVTDSSHTRYLKIKFLSHYLDEELFTLSQVKVFGQTVFASLQDEVALSEENDIKMLLQDVRDDLQREDWLLSNESEDTSGSAPSSSPTEAAATITIEPTDSSNGQDTVKAQNSSADTALVTDQDPVMSDATGGTSVEDQGQPGESTGDEIDSIRSCPTTAAGESACPDSSHDNAGVSQVDDRSTAATSASDSVVVSHAVVDDRAASLTVAEEIPSGISQEKEKDAVVALLEAQIPSVDHSLDNDETQSVHRESTPPIHHDDALHLNQTEWGLVHTALQRANLTADILTQAYQSMKGFMADSASKKIDVSRLLQYISSQKGPTVKQLDASTEESIAVGSSLTDRSSASTESASGRTESPDTVDTSSTATQDVPSTAAEDRNASRHEELVGPVTADTPPSDSSSSSPTAVESLSSSTDEEHASSSTTSAASDGAESTTTVDAMPPVDELATFLHIWPMPPAPPSSFPTILSTDESISSPDASGASDASTASVSSANESMDNASTTTTTTTTATTPPPSETMPTTAQPGSPASTSTSTSTLTHEINPTQAQPAKPSSSSSSASSASSSSTTPATGFQQQVHWMTCMDQLKFSEFQARLMAKLQQKNGSTSMDTASLDVNAHTTSPGVNHHNIFKQIIQRMKTLETNQAITEIYLSQLSDCLRLMRDEMMDRQQAQEEHDLRAQQNPLSALFTLALSNITVVSVAQGASIVKIPAVLPTSAPTTATTTATTTASSSSTATPETIILPTTYSPFLLPLLAPPSDAPFDAFWSRMVSFLRSLIRIMSQFVWIVTLAGKHDQAALLTSTLQELRLLLQSSVIEFWCALVCGLVIALVAGILVVLMMCMWMMVWCCGGSDRRDGDHRNAVRRRYVQQ